TPVKVLVSDKLNALSNSSDPMESIGEVDLSSGEVIVFCEGELSTICGLFWPIESNGGTITRDWTTRRGNHYKRLDY
ncbi:MAG: hypothetical protein ACW977_15150, partial [Candidatus Thorarchaeota archaeon]